MVLFRLDAGPGIGLGHLARCLSLADALGSLGVGCTFATTTPEVVGPRVGRHSVRAIDAPPGSEGDARVTAAAGDDLVVLDGYTLGSRHAEALAGRRVLWIDDAGFAETRPGIVLNHHVHASPALYPAMKQALLGPAYALLRPEFAAARGRAGGAGGARVLVTMGGADPDDASSRVLDALDRLPARPPVAVLVGPLNPRAERIAARAEVVFAPDDVAAELARSALVVTAAGGTCLELCCVGVPAIAVAIAENQRPIVQALGAAGLMRPSTLEPAELAGVAAELLADAVVRRRMVAAQRAAVDGEGAARVARRIREELA